MKPLTLETVADWSGGRLMNAWPTGLVNAVSTDTRKIAPGSLFVALVGENFDGHDFVEQAVKAGAAAVMVSHLVRVPEGIGVILTEDTLDGLQRLAMAYRKDWGGIVLGLTGSNGKTSTKDFTAAVLAKAMPVRATAGNLNNHIGLPLTVLTCDPEDKIGVFEMGMNHPGEIEPLTQIAGPQAAIITNVGTAHIEFMRTREAIGKEKGELAAAVPSDGIVILNANDDFTPAIRARCKARVLDAGDVRVTDVASSATGCSFILHLPDGSSAPVKLGVPGRHMAGNAALAAAAGFHFGVRVEDIAAALEAASLTKGRVQVRGAGGLTLIDDSYNANPDSMRAAFSTLRDFDCGGRRIAVLGRMAELGETAEAAHRETGADAAAGGVDFLCVVGSLDAPLIADSWLQNGGAFENLVRVENNEAAAAWLRRNANPEDVILVKGSRSSGMERIIELLAD